MLCTLRGSGRVDVEGTTPRATPPRGQRVCVGNHALLSAPVSLGTSLTTQIHPPREERGVTCDGVGWMPEGGSVSRDFGSRDRHPPRGRGQLY